MLQDGHNNCSVINQDQNIIAADNRATVTQLGDGHCQVSNQHGFDNDITVLQQ